MGRRRVSPGATQMARRAECSPQGGDVKHGRGTDLRSPGARCLARPDRARHRRRPPRTVTDNEAPLRSSAVLRALPSRALVFSLLQFNVWPFGLRLKKHHIHDADAADQCGSRPARSELIEASPGGGVLGVRIRGSVGRGRVLEIESSSQGSIRLDEAPDRPRRPDAIRMIRVHPHHGCCPCLNRHHIHDADAADQCGSRPARSELIEASPGGGRASPPLRLRARPRCPVLIRWPPTDR
jgi:hypothetical protein